MLPGKTPPIIAGLNRVYGCTCFLFVWQSDVNVLCSWRRWRLHYKTVLANIQNHLTTSRVLCTPTTFLTLDSHLNRVELYDIVWICMLILCCVLQWAWFPYLSPAHQKGPLHIEDGVKSKDRTGKTPRRNGVLKDWPNGKKYTCFSSTFARRLYIHQRERENKIIWITTAFVILHTTILEAVTILCNDDDSDGGQSSVHIQPLSYCNLKVVQQFGKWTYLFSVRELDENTDSKWGERKDWKNMPINTSKALVVSCLFKPKSKMRLLGWARTTCLEVFVGRLQWLSRVLPDLLPASMYRDVYKKKEA